MNRPVVTLTLNPAIDETIVLDRLVPGAVHRAQKVRFDAGGKGINVASCLADWGGKVTVTGLLGSDNDTVFRTLFNTKGIQDSFIRVAGTTRTNIKLLHQGVTTDVNLPGLDIHPQRYEELRQAILDVIEPGSIVVLSGSVPKGISPCVYRDLIPTLAQQGITTMLDTSGQPLAEALDQTVPQMPFCIKPNRTELETWAGQPLPTIDAILVAANALLARGVQLIVVSMGEQGALFASAEQVLLASAPVVSGVSTVGAGDAMVAGIVAAMSEGADLERTARLATGFAVGKLGLPGAQLPPRHQIEANTRGVTIIPRH